MFVSDCQDPGLSAPSRNPFRPGFNRSPQLLAGRDEILGAARSALAEAASGTMPTSLMLVGSRGVGKTVLLREVADIAGQHYGSPRLRVEVTSPGSFVPHLLHEAALVEQTLGTTRPAGGLHAASATIRAGVAGVGAEVTLDRSAAPAFPDYYLIRDALARLAETLRTTGSPLVVSVDEAQVASRDDLSSFAAALQYGEEEDWPVVVVLAGLPSMRDPGRSVTYFERSNWYEVTSLDRSATIEALGVPAQQAGRPFEPAALQHLAERTGGYPYAVQLYGYHAWSVSEGHGRITLAHAQAAAGPANTQLEQGLYLSRWNQASRREQEYLAAVAAVIARGESATATSIAAQLGRAPKEVAVYRERLIAKGTLVTDGRQSAFTVPGMAGFVQRTAAAARRRGAGGDEEAARAIHSTQRGRRRPRPPDLGR